MKVRSRILAVVAAATMVWSSAANAEPNYWEAQVNYMNVMAEIHNHCSLMWTYDPNPNSPYGGCVVEQKFGWAQVMYTAASIYMNTYYPDGTNVGETYYLVADALYFGL